MGSSSTLAATSGLSLPSGSYIYCIAALDYALTAISSDDSLRVFDPETLQLTSGPALENVHVGVTCLKSVSSSSVITAGRDGFIRYWDSRRGEKSLEIKDSTSAPFLSLDISKDGSAVAAGTELTHFQATVQIWDLRAPRDPSMRYLECHNDDVTELSYHPTQSSCLLSGSTDGLVNIYNTAILDEDEGLVQVFNHGASISHAGFLPESALYALSHDETLSIYDLANPEDDSSKDNPQNPIKFGDLRPQLGCEYVVDILPTNGGAIVGAGSHSTCKLDLIPLTLISNWWTLNKENITCIRGAHSGEIIRTIHINSQTSMTYTGGEDGKVKAWRPGTLAQHTGHFGPTRHKRKRDSPVEGKHHKPY